MGKAVCRLDKDTHVALVQLGEDVSYQNKMFDYLGAPATILESLRGPRELQTADRVFIDTSFLGLGSDKGRTGAVFVSELYILCLC